MKQRAMLFCTLATLLLSCTEKSTEPEFELWYAHIGLGSNCASKQPVLRVSGNEYTYTLEETCSWNGDFTLAPETLAVGKLRSSSIDSILILASSIPDSFIYNTNTIISSGGIHKIQIESTQKSLEFKLHNASNPIAEKNCCHTKLQPARKHIQVVVV